MENNPVLDLIMLYMNDGKEVVGFRGDNVYNPSAVIIELKDGTTHPHDIKPNSHGQYIEWSKVARLYLKDKQSKIAPTDPLPETP